MEYLLIPVTLFLAFGNGANDNFKGFATVWGSEILSYRNALLLATLATALGSMLSLLLASGLAQQFSGKGLLPQSIVDGPQFIFSVGISAALTVFIATRAGLPISTTHALIGGLIGAGWAASPEQVQFAMLFNSFLLPLLLSPIAAAVLGLLIYRLLRLSTLETTCACVVRPQPHIPSLDAAISSITSPQLVIAAERECDKLERPVVRFSIGGMLERLHIFSAGLICFARAVNDTPKLAGLLIAANMLDARVSILLIGGAMAIGGLILARRVAETMSRRVTRMDSRQGVAANLITAVIVLGASHIALPVSTTHVSVGSIAGVGAAGNTLDWNTLRNVLLSWIATLPMAAGIAWIAMELI